MTKKAIISKLMYTNKNSHVIIQMYIKKMGQKLLGGCVMKKVKIALLGFGNVGRGVWRIVHGNSEEITKRSGYQVEIAKVLVRNANKDRGIDRFTTLLKHVGLEDRIITPSSSVKEILAKRVNWDSVNEKIRKKKESSINFLVDILS